MGTHSTPETTPKRRRVAQTFVWHEPSHLVGIARYAKQANWILDFVPVYRPEFLASWKGDGMICQLHSSADRLIEAVGQHHLPKVELADYNPDLNVPTVIPDYYTAGRLVAEHFYSRGFRDFAFLSFVFEPQEDLLIYKGFKDYVLGKNGRFNPVACTIRGEESEIDDLPLYERLENDFAARLAQLPKPLAVLAEDSTLGVVAIDSCTERGILIPEEIAIVAAGSSEPEWDLSPIPLSCIVPDYERQGYEAAALLDRLMSGEPPPTQPILTPFKKVEVRNSSDVIAVRNPQVARALVYIIRNYHFAGLSVSDVVQATTLSRATLYREFEKCVGRSISSEISRVRIENASRMLRSTKEKIVRIAELCGYSNPKRFSESFRRTVGQSPRQYRLRSNNPSTLQNEP